MKKHKELISWVITIAAAVLIAVLLNAFVFKIVVVNKTSMVPTLNSGDKVFLSKITYTFSEPKSGDIIVFSRDNDPETYYIKRVIGLPGDTIDILDGKVYRNGVELNEPYIAEITEDTLSVTVPEGEYFVMGDNRNLSVDSKNPQFGNAKRENILGKVVFSISPFGKIEKYNHDYANKS